MARSFFMRHKKVFRLLVVISCIGGFTYQSLEFFNLYWTYPTVVDIQDISPTYLEIPSITFCNPIGYHYKPICDYRTPDGLNIGACLPSGINRYVADAICSNHKAVCDPATNQVPRDFQIVTYSKFMSLAVITTEDQDLLRVPLESYLKCSLEFGGIKVPCKYICAEFQLSNFMGSGRISDYQLSLTNVMGSFFSKTEMPQFCYSIYSLWGNPDGERVSIPKGTVMHLQFNLNTTQRYYSPRNLSNPKTIYEPMHNLPDSPSIQMGVHSPYFLPSPFLDGYNYIGGRAYDIRISMREKHLLPAPYQTNCTDYMKIWRERGGKAPIDQMGVIQECRMNKTIEARDCVPIELDYPQTAYNICRTCVKNCQNETATHECLQLAESFTQPCDSISYSTIREDRTITVYQEIRTVFLRQKEGTRMRLKEYDCVDNKVWRPECGSIDIDVLFDRFEISNLTYFPKFESLEIFSVIGGYMGMWLGISLVTIYDLIGTVFKALSRHVAARNRKRVKPNKNSFDYYRKEIKLLTKSDKPLYW